MPRCQPSCLTLREVTISEALNILICRMKRLGQVTSWALNALPHSRSSCQTQQLKKEDYRESTVQLGTIQKNVEFLEKAWGIRHHFIQVLLSAFSLCKNNNNTHPSSKPLALLPSQSSHLGTRSLAFSITESLQWPFSFSLPSLYKVQIQKTQDLGFDPHLFFPPNLKTTLCVHICQTDWVLTVQYPQHTANIPATEHLHLLLPSSECVFSVLATCLDNNS